MIARLRAAFTSQTGSKRTAAGVPPRPARPLDNVEAIKKGVETGRGLSLIPRIAAEAEIKAGTLVPLAPFGTRRARPTRRR